MHIHCSFKSAMEAHDIRQKYISVERVIVAKFSRLTQKTIWHLVAYICTACRSKS